LTEDDVPDLIVAVESLGFFAAPIVRLTGLLGGLVEEAADMVDAELIVLSLLFALLVAALCDETGAVDERAEMLPSAVERGVRPVFLEAIFAYVECDLTGNWHVSG
jgi:hypothetical protein